MGYKGKISVEWRSIKKKAWLLNSKFTQQNREQFQLIQSVFAELYFGTFINYASWTTWTSNGTFWGNSAKAKIKNFQQIEAVA